MASNEQTEKPPCGGFAESSVHAGRSSDALRVRAWQNYRMLPAAIQSEKTSWTDYVASVVTGAPMNSISYIGASKYMKLPKKPDGNTLLQRIVNVAKETLAENVPSKKAITNLASWFYMYPFVNRRNDVTIINVS